MERQIRPDLDLERERQRMLGSMPRIDREPGERLRPIPGTPPSLINVPSGCPFHPRCAYAGRTGGRSRSDRPELLPAGDGHLVACHLADAERRRIWAAEIKPNL